MKKQLLLFVLLLAGISMTAQNRPESYNYKRGVEAVQNEKVDEALDFFYKDLQENAKNGYSYSWIAYIHNYNEEYGKALNAANQALKNLPKKDKEYVAFAYATRGDIYLHLEDTIKAIEDYTSAIKVDPENYSMYEKRANRYFEQKKYDLSDADYRKEIELNPGGTMGYMGIGRNANAQKRWDEAIKQFDQVTKLASDYSSGYSFRAESYLGLKKWDEATDDLITSLTLDWDRMAMHLLSTVEKPAMTMLIAKMRVQAAKSPNETKWPYLIGSIYEQNKEYEKAVKAYREANAKDPSPVIYKRIAVCCSELGDFDEALASINNALNLDSTDIDYMSYKANIYYEMDKPEMAISEWDKILVKKPDYGWGYYRRGWFKELMGDLDGAVEDLSMSVVLEPEYTYARVSRGEIYSKQGKKDLAEADFKKVIEIEDSPEKYECLHYAYHGLGLDDKAVAAIDSIIARDTTDAGSYYEAACLYSRMHDKKNALANLEKSLELGYNRFAHINRDFDMDFLRETEEFKALLKKYQTDSTKTTRTTGPIERNAENSVMTEIPFVKENGICKVKCNINGLPLHFVFDTGASDVTISMVEATFMMKNGYLDGNDVVGSRRYMDANGDVSVGTVVNLKKVSFGDLELNNVRASVVRNQKAPLLLGQSVLGRLGKIEIDNPGRVLKITQQKNF